VNVLLISPPTTSAVKSVVGATGPPLGLDYLASMYTSRLVSEAIPDFSGLCCDIDDY